MKALPMLDHVMLWVARVFTFLIVILYVGAFWIDLNYLFTGSAQYITLWHALALLNGSRLLAACIAFAALFLLPYRILLSCVGVTSLYMLIQLFMALPEIRTPGPGGLHGPDYVFFNPMVIGYLSVIWISFRGYFFHQSAYKDQDSDHLSANPVNPV